MKRINSNLTVLTSYVFIICYHLPTRMYLHTSMYVCKLLWYVAPSKHAALWTTCAYSGTSQVEDLFRILHLYVPSYRFVCTLLNLRYPASTQNSRQLCIEGSCDVAILQFFAIYYSSVDATALSWLEQDLVSLCYPKLPGSRDSCVEASEILGLVFVCVCAHEQAITSSYGKYWTPLL